MPLHTVTTDQLAINTGKFVKRASKQLIQLALLHHLIGIRKRHRSQGRDRESTTCVQITQCMICGNPSHNPRIGHQLSQGIYTLHNRDAGRRMQRYSVVTLFHTIPGIRLLQAFQYCTKSIRTDLGTTTAAVWLPQHTRQTIRGYSIHRRGQLLETSHKAAVYTVFPAPYPGPGRTERPSIRCCTPVSE